MNPIQNTKNCAICETQKVRGINLYTLFVCTECEQEMIHTEPEDERYKVFVNKLKAMNHTTLYS